LEAIPVDHNKGIVSMHEGFTPLRRMKFFEHEIIVKQDYLFQTGSFKDRGASVLITKCHQLGIESVVEDSSGNSASAISAYSLISGIRCHLFVPSGNSSEKINQIRTYSSEITYCENREDAFRKAFEAGKRTYYASHCWNPFFIHGTKTFLFELCEQMGWSLPDAIVIPVGSGSLLLGTYIGIMDLQSAGLITKVPKLIGIRSAASPELFDDFHSRQSTIPIEDTPTIAEGIAVRVHPRKDEILDAVKKTEGTFLTVTESEIVDALKNSILTGFYIEPTSAAAVAGVRKYLSLCDKYETIAVPLTGHGLKATKKIADILSENS